MVEMHEKALGAPKMLSYRCNEVNELNKTK